MEDVVLKQLALKLVKLLEEKNLKIATAESCTGGMAAEFITSVSGASKVFDYGIISYSNSVKASEIFVSEKSLEEYGAVSEQVAREMAKGVMQKAKSDIGISTTGIAGPTGGTKEKPVGTVHIAVASGDYCFHKKLSLMDECGNNRYNIRKTTVEKLFMLAIKTVEGLC